MSTDISCTQSAAKSISSRYTSKQKLIQVLCSIIWCLLGSGVIFGFASLKPVLIKEGVYSFLCNDNGNLPFGKACDSQDLKLNKLFSYGACMTNLSALIVGMVLDKYGPKCCGYVGCALIAIGSLILSYNAPLYQYFDSYLVGYIVLAVGGPFVFISCFQLANTFPRYSGTILALISGAFDTSSAIFLFYRLAYENGFSGVDLHVFFKYYLIVPLFIFMCQWLIMPSESYKNNGSTDKNDTLGDIQRLAVEGLDGQGELPLGTTASRTGATEEAAAEEFINTDETDSLLDNNSVLSSKTINNRRKSKIEILTEQQLYTKSRGVFGIMHNHTAKDQIKSGWFILIQCFTILCMLRINYFVATVRSQQEYLLGSYEKALQMNTIFDIALPLGGVVAIPLVGILLDNVDTVTVLRILFGTSIAVGSLGLIKNSFYASLSGIILLTMYRPFYYTVVSDYCSKVFGFETFGTVYGLLMTLAGLCNLTQNRLDYWTHYIFNKNPTPINCFLTLATLISGISLLAYIDIKLKKHRPYVKKPSSFNEYGSI
ncbi:hypothetical protein QEN19_001358 [Hanseniaspora menglaensis]